MWMTRVSINNPVFATMVMVAFVVLGLFYLMFRLGYRTGYRKALEKVLEGLAKSRRLPSADKTRRVEQEE